MRNFEGRATTKTELNFELYFVTEVLHLRSLHYGYWDGARETVGVDLREMADAQARFTDRLIDFVPPDVKTVLDVGAGIGDNARALARRGHRVKAISPDGNHQSYFDEIDEPNISFERSTFEAFETDDRFDLVLFSESHRYFDRRFGLERARQLISPGGHLLVSGMFRNDDKAPFPLDFDISHLPYLALAGEVGFRLARVRDITDNVLPTIEMIDHAVDETLEPTLRFAEAYLSSRSPWKAKLLRIFLGRQGDELERQLRKLKRKTNPERFRERYRYATVLLRAC